MPKNITLAIDEDLLDKVRVLAAMKRTSVNEMVRQFLEREVTRETAQVTRAEVWGRLFAGADQDFSNRGERQPGKVAVDRQDFYEGVMRERRLL